MRKTAIIFAALLTLALAAPVSAAGGCAAFGQAAAAEAQQQLLRTDVPALATSGPMAVPELIHGIQQAVCTG
jgi:hypothetical protein